MPEHLPGRGRRTRPGGGGEERGCRQARLSVEDVHELLRASGQLKDQLPGRSTLHRKLSGVGLRNERRLVEAVIEVCVSDASDSAAWSEWPGSHTRA